MTDRQNEIERRLERMEAQLDHLATALTAGGQAPLSRQGNGAHLNGTQKCGPAAQPSTRRRSKRPAAADRARSRAARPAHQRRERPRAIPCCRGRTGALTALGGRGQRASPSTWPGISAHISARYRSSWAKAAERREPLQRPHRVGAVDGLTPQRSPAMMPSSDSGAPPGNGAQREENVASALTRGDGLWHVEAWV